MYGKRKTLTLRTIIGIFLTMFLLCVLPQHSAAEGIQQICLGGNHSAALKSDGSLWMWGNNSYGQLGNNSTTDSNTPVQVMTGVKQVSLGSEHSAAVKKDGSLWVWGRNIYGQVGNGAVLNSITPEKIMTGVKQVSLGGNYSAALKTDGSLWMWGSNIYGQLGNGSNTDSRTPIQVMTNVKQICLGLYHSAAIKTDGSLWMWGENNAAQLGNNSFSNSNTPIKVMTGVKQVSLGNKHSAAVTQDGSLWMWGDGSSGQIGDGSSGMTTAVGYGVYIKTPIKLMTGVKQVNLGGSHSAAIKADGSLWMWGFNYSGQVGNGVSGIVGYWGAHSTTPEKIMDGVKEVNLGSLHSAAVKTNGSLWTWGNNEKGQLGNGSNKNSSTPLEIRLPASGTLKTNIGKCKITLSKKKYTYTGKAIKPLPTVKYNGKTLKNKIDYTLSYKNNKKKGSATIVIKGKGAYTGQSQIKFTIKK